MVDDTRVTSRAIDAVAASMTAGDGAPDVRAQVLARLSLSHPTPWFRGAPLLRGLAAATMIIAIAGAFLSRRERPATAPVRNPTLGANSNVEAASAIATAATATPAANGARRARVPVRVAITPGLPALAPAPSILIETIQPDRLSIPQLTVAPLAASPLRISPVDGSGSER